MDDDDEDFARHLTIGLDSAAYQQLTCWLTVNFECECRSQQRRRMTKLNSQTKALRGPIGSADVDAATESSRVELRLRGCRQLLVFSRWRWTRSGKAKSLSGNIHNILLENKFLNKQNIFKSAKTQVRVISSVCVRAAETKHFQVPKRARVAYVT